MDVAVANFGEVPQTTGGDRAGRRAVGGGGAAQLKADASEDRECC